ncbi:MAG TPA: rRNA maturation RNase YbeY [Burkholderiales bacterium]|nr:rRNA maturation RNase YbeY [Burkholderiales bacterium]
MHVQRAVRGAPAAARLRAFARAAARPGQTITLRVVGAAEARTLNRTFRRRDYPTNVLSFGYSRTHGDIVLCHPVIAREARAQGKSLAAHYAHLVVHGVLHLRGHDHARAAAARRMERREVALLARLGFADPYTVE